MMSSSETERFSLLDDEEFANLVARTWREYGWTVVEPTREALPAGTGDVAEPVDGGVAFVARAAERRLLLTAPGEAGTLTAATLLSVLSKAASPDDLLVVSAVGYDTGALSIADAYGIDILGPEELEKLTHPSSEEALVER